MSTRKVSAPWPRWFGVLFLLFSIANAVTCFTIGMQWASDNTTAPLLGVPLGATLAMWPLAVSLIADRIAGVFRRASHR